MTLIDTATGGVVTVGAPAEFVLTVQQDGEPLDLQGKTVTATVRLASKPLTPVHADLEGIAATVTDAENGEVTVLLTDTLTEHLDAPSNVAQSRDHYLQLVVVEDDYAPNPLKFLVRRAAAAL